MSTLMSDTPGIENDRLGSEASSGVEDARRTATSVFERYGLSTLDVLLCFAVFLAMCAYTPFLYTWFWAPRMAIVLATVLPGLIALGGLAKRGDRAARIAVGLLAWSVVSAVASDNAWLSLRGTIAQNTFVLSYAAAFGLWALAQYMTKSGRGLMLTTVLVGVSINAAVGAVQMFLQLDGGNLGLWGGRAVGLTPNPIELAALMLVGIFICLGLTSDGPLQSHRFALIGLFAYGTVLAFTSTRIALIAFVVVSIGCVATRRNVNQLIGSGVAIIGVVSGTMLFRVFGTEGDALSRSSSVAAGGRVDWWFAGWHALTERPVLGWGAGRFRSAIQGELSFAHIAAHHDSQAIPDAHNIFVSFVVELGLPGLVLLIAFGILAVRRSAGVYSLALIAVPIIWLLQPLALTTVIVFMVMLGIATTSGASAGNPSPPDAGRMSTNGGAVFIGATVVGLAAAGWLLVAEYRLSEAVLAVDVEAFDAAAPMYLGDPIVSNVGYDLWIRSIGDSERDQDPRDETIDRIAQTVDLEPTRAYWHSRLAWGFAYQGDYPSAIAEVDRALELQPTSVLAWRTLLYISDKTDDARLHSQAMDGVCRLELDACVTAIGGD